MVKMGECAQVQPTGQSICPVQQTREREQTICDFETSIEPDTSENHENNSEQDVRVTGRIRKQTFTYIAEISLGAAVSILGPSLIDLEELFSTDTKSISASFLAVGAGYLVGSLLSGFIFDRVIPEVQLATTCLVMGVSTAVAPLPGKLEFFVAATVVQGMSMGYTDAASMAFIVTVWTGHRWADPIAQAIPSMWCVGGTLCPMILQFFLTGSVHVVKQSSHIFNVTANGTCNDGDSCTTRTTTGYTNMTLTASTSLVSDISRHSNVQTGYLVMGGLMCIGGVLFWLEICYGFRMHTIRSLRRRITVPVAASDFQTDQKYIRYFILSSLFIWLLLYSVLQGSMANLIATFVVKGLSWPNNRGSLISSVFWGTFGLGTLMSVALSAAVEPLWLVLLCCTLCTLGFLLMSTLVHLHANVAWVCTTMVGVGLAAGFQSIVMWSIRFTVMTGVLSSVCIQGVATGFMVGPAMAGYCFQTYGHMSLPYMGLAISLVMSVGFIFMHLYATRASTKHKCPTGEPPVLTERNAMLQLREAVRAPTKGNSD